MLTQEDTGWAFNLILLGRLKILAVMCLELLSMIQNQRCLLFLEIMIAPTLEKMKFSSITSIGKLLQLPKIQLTRLGLQLIPLLVS
jgi:hypothetical protein